MDTLKMQISKSIDLLKAKISHFYKNNDHRKPRFWIIVSALLIALFFLHACSSSHHKKRPDTAVVLAVAKTTDVPIYLSALGAVTPTYSVTVRTQVNGLLMQVFFKEGQMVKAGDLLAQIDPRPYEAQLLQYEGQLARDSALLTNSQLDLTRYQKLWRQDSVAKQTLDTQISLVNQNEGTVKIDQGLIDNTKLNLIYTRITSPIDGRVGLRLVDPGNYVQTADTTGIAIINMLNPITVVFSLAEDYVPQVMDQINAGKTLLVKAYDRQQTRLLDTGTLLTIDNQIDPTTGTVKLKAQFQNNANLLFPNQFVNVRLLVNTLSHVTIIPTAAVQHTPQGPIVYLANTNSTVSVKPVTVSVTTDDNTVVTTGVLPGQLVVVEGADKLADGMPVNVTGAIQLPPKQVKKQNFFSRFFHQRASA